MSPHSVDYNYLQIWIDSIDDSMLNVIALDPFQTPPSYEKLIGDLKGYYSRRINIQHRIVYRVYPDLQIVVIHAMWTHYGE